MIIMIIFLFLTLVMVLCTAYYLDYKKKSVNKVIKQTSTNQEQKEDTKSKKKLTDILEVKIKDNIICIANRYSMLIKLGNIDYNMLSVGEQSAVEDVLIQSALAIDYPIQFFTTTEYIDTSKVVALLKKNKTRNHKVTEYKEYLIEYLNNLMENRTISVVKNYAIISYDGYYESAIEELNRKSNSFKNNLLRAKIVCEILSEDEIYNLIYRELNKNSALNISALKEGVKNLYVNKK